MDNKVTFGKWEAVCLLINIINTQIFISFPRLITETGGTAGWIVSIYILILSLIGFWLISKLFKRFPNKDIIDIGQEVGGKIVYVILGLSLGVLGIILEAITLREFSENVKTISLTNSPISFIMALFIFGAVFSCYFGIEPIVRIHAIGTSIIAVIYLIILLALLPLMDIDNVMPVMGNGPYKIFGEGFFRLSFFTGLIIAFYLPPFIKSFKKFKSSVYTSIIFSGLFMTIGTLVYLMVIPYPSSLENTIPIYDLSRLINYGRFFQRIEPLFLTIWSFAAYLYFCGGLYFSIYAIKKALNLPYFEPLIIPLAIIMFNLSILPESFMSAVKIENIFSRTYSFIPIFGIPILLLIVARIRKKGSVDSQDSST